MMCKAPYVCLRDLDQLHPYIAQWQQSTAELLLTELLSCFPVCRLNVTFVDLKLSLTVSPWNAFCSKDTEFCAGRQARHNALDFSATSPTCTKVYLWIPLSALTVCYSTCCNAMNCRQPSFLGFHEIGIDLQQHVTSAESLSDFRRCL